MPQPPGEEGQGQQHKGYHREQERHGSNSLQQSLLDIVQGTEPEFEECTPVTSSFADFLEKIIKSELEL